MIITLEKRVNRIMVEGYVTAFRKQGLKVFVKNGDGSFTLAVFKSENDQDDCFSTNCLVGVKRIKSGNELFLSRRQEFIPAEDYFRE